MKFKGKTCDVCTYLACSTTCSDDGRKLKISEVVAQCREILKDRSSTFKQPQLSIIEIFTALISCLNRIHGNMFNVHKET